jgi:fibro-slime domain-containing protein
VGAWSACSVAVATRECRTICGSGQESCRDGKWGDCSAPRPGPPKLKVIVRDFNDTHPDFERSGGSSTIDTAIVQKVLGSDDKPVYAGMPSTISTTGKQFFDEWYHDTPGVNLSTAITISLTPSASNPNVFNYDNDAFFPIDGQLFGNQARPHNYDFTVELSTQFRYVGGETFRFTGDDDLFVFVNRNLAINLGGTHQAASGAVDLDAQAMALGLVKGNIYPFHLFFAERHVVSSTFHIQTSITEFASCD